MEEIVGYIAALGIGISLGLIGGGGSILTVPVLVYLLGVEPVLATAYSLFIVGISSLFGSFKAYRQGLVDVRTALVFGAPAIVSVYITRRFILPNIPDVVFTFQEHIISKPLFLMLLFALVMLVASVSMITKKCNFVTERIEDEKRKFNYVGILIEGLLVGSLTGLVGAGGGFLIIPALVLFSKLPMRKAVGTSLFIIAAKSLIGFTGDVGHMPIDWLFLGLFSLISVMGIVIGLRLSKKISPCQLTHGFGWFVLLMGIYVLVRELSVLF